MNLKQAFQKITASISGSSHAHPQTQPGPATQQPPIVNPLINPSRDPVGYFMLNSGWF